MKNLLRMFVTMGLLALFAFSMTGCGSDDDVWFVPAKAPAAPTGVIATFNNSSSATVSWNPVATATSYNVYYSTAPGVTKLDYDVTVNTSATSYTFEGLASDTTYYFVVTAVRSSKESVESLEVSAIWQPSQQSALYGTTVGTEALGTSDLVLLDPDTGAFIETVGPVGYYVNGLTYDDTNDKLYATTSANDLVFPNGLIEINTSTGAGTPIGTGLGMVVTTPTVNSSGAMFGWRPPVIPEGSAALVSINKADGTATLIGEATLSTAEHGLAFDNFDVLMLVTPFEATNTIAYSINTDTGASTFTAFFADIPRAHHGDFHPDTNYYWGIDETDFSAEGAAARNLLVLDIATPAVIGTPLPTADYLHAIAFGFISVPN